MNGSTLTLFLVMAAVIVMLIAACLFVFSRHSQVRSQHDVQVQENTRLHEQLDARATEHMQLQTQMNNLAIRQFEEWRSRELENAQKQLRETAYSEARVMMEDWRQKWEATIRAQAISQSGAVITGRVTEQLVPYMGIFPYNPKDVRFIGSPIDLIVFDGMSEGNLRRVIFLEVKTGSSTMSTRQRQIRDALQGRRVEWGELRITN